MASSKWEKAEPMRVQYRNKHHEDRPCEREIVIPEGWERMPAGEYLDIEFSGCLIEGGDFWVPFEKSIIGAAIIRPKKPAIPEGYERVPDSELQSATAYLTPHGGTVQVFVGHDFIAGGVYLRPVRQPFRLSGPGWYKTRGGEYWTKLNEKQITNYHPDGRERTGLAGPAHDLIARATPAQEKILEGL